MRLKTPTQIKTFRVEVFVGGTWRFWGTVKALDRVHAEVIVYGNSKLPVSKFRIVR